MATPLLRSLSALLVALVVACSGPAPTDPPVTPATVAPEVPTASPVPAPTDSFAPTGPTGPTGPTPPSSSEATPGPTATAQPTATPEPTPTIDGPIAAHFLDDLKRVSQRDLDRYAIPGMTVTLMFSDESEWSGGFGEADVERDVPAGPDVPFVAGSISKTFVAATVLQLVDEGELALTDPLSNWLPDYPRAGEIQIVHLLSHTSGVFNYFEDPDYNDSVFQTEVGRDWEPSEILDEFGGPPYCDPGTCFHYSNTGFVLLGLVIEQVTGESLGTVFTERFFEPLGMTDTYFQEDAPPPPGTAVGYLERPVGLRPVDDGSGYRPTKSAATVAWAAGAVVSTAHDLAVWVRALYGGEIVSRDSLERMIGTDYSPRADEIYGLGTRSRFFGDVQMYGHTGSLRGFYAAAWHVPSQDLTIVVMTNLGRIDPNEIVDDLADVVL